MLGTGVANTICASGLASRKQAGHLIASNRVRNLIAPYKRGAVHICNLNCMTKGIAEVARSFSRPGGSRCHFAAEIYPGYPGLVIAEGEIRAMTWGFHGKQEDRQLAQGQPVNNARGDKLATAFWRDSFGKRRLLIRVTDWAEAEGSKGSMTRTWYSLPDEPIFAVAGVWRPTAEWGDAYSMVIVDGCLQMADVHDRMPTIVAREDWARWTDGTPDEAMELCRIWACALSIERTPEPWFKARSSAVA